jgi:hypothetical protein
MYNFNYQKAGSRDEAISLPIHRPKTVLTWPVA